MDFWADHGNADIARMALLLEIIPATPRLSRALRETDLRYACAPNPASFTPLLPSGAEYVRVPRRPVPRVPPAPATACACAS
jgi:hypothetical protein